MNRQEASPREASGIVSPDTRHERNFRLGLRGRARGWKQRRDGKFTANGKLQADVVTTVPGRMKEQLRSGN